MGLTHLDAGVIIGFLDRHDAHHEAARGALERARERRDHLAMAASAVAESLVGPARRGEEAINAVRELLAVLPIEVVPLDEDIAVAAARLRARHRSLRLPDALVVAAAHTRQAGLLITTDRRWPSARALGVSTRIEHV